MIRVLVVEDDPIAAEAHAHHVARVPGFAVAGWAATGTAALRHLGTDEVHLVLLDLNLPDRHGLDVVRAMRGAGHHADVIAVTSARDLAVIRAAVSQGIVQYLLKPFTGATLRGRLERYREYRSQVVADRSVTSQQQVDRLLAVLRTPDRPALPKGMSTESLEAVSVRLRKVSAGPAGCGMSAAEVAAALGTSRVTARRYLEYLGQTGLASRRARYGGTGRPELEYRWSGPP